MFGKSLKYLIVFFTKPLFLVLSLIAILGFFVQIFFPHLYFSNQEALRNQVLAYRPYDVLAFIVLQIFQVIVAPVSHYFVTILGGAIYGPWLGGLYNWIGRVIGHIAAYWLGRLLGRRIIKLLFAKRDLEKYDKFVKGTDKTLYIRLIILFLMLFLPLFPDDEISYFVGFAALNFWCYLIVLLLGHLGGSFALAYVGAGINTKDVWFWILTTVTIILACALIYYVKKFGKMKKKTMV